MPEEDALLAILMSHRLIALQFNLSDFASAASRSFLYHHTYKYFCSGNRYFSRSIINPYDRNPAGTLHRCIIVKQNSVILFKVEILSIIWALKQHAVHGYITLYLYPALLQSWHLRMKQTDFFFLTFGSFKHSCVNWLTDGLCSQMSAWWGEPRGEMNIIT